MAEITLPDIAEAVVKEIPNFFNDAIDQIRAGEGAYLRDGDPQGTVARIGQAVGRSACRQFGANPVGSTLVNSERFERACRPYLDSLALGNGLEVAVPFTGGQCAGIQYKMVGSVNFTTFVASLNQTFNSTIDVTGGEDLTGPIGGITFRYDTPGSSGNRRWIMDIVANGQLIQGYRSFTNPNSENSVSDASFDGNFTDASGSEGDCGFPPPTVRQPRPQPDPTPPPFRFTPVPGVDIGIDVTVNPDGTISFDFGDGERTVDPFAEGEENPGNVTPEPGDQGAPGGAGDTGGGGEADGEAPAGQVLVGLKMDLLNTPPDRYLVANGVYRGGAYIYMGGDVALDQDFAGSLLMSGQFVFAEKENLTKWRVKSNTGFNWRVTPYYREAT